MTSRPMPGADIDVTPDLVRRLLADQHPDLAGLPVTVLAHGWDNLVCRLGDHHLVRLPRRRAAARLVEHEQRWLPELARRLPLPIPAPVRCGRAAAGYPWAWSVVPFLPGDTAAVTPPADPAATATTLGTFLAALHTPAPHDAPTNPSRGVPLAGRAHGVTAGLAYLTDRDERAAALRIWEAAVTAPVWPGPARWLHGDLHPANLLVADGRLSAVIDFGDITAGDPAADLSVAWMLLPRSHHRVFRRAYGDGADDATWARARGWALALMLVFVTHSADNPVMAAVGQRTRRYLLRP